MAIPVYLFLYDDQNRLIKGDVDVQDRERSIEVLELMHAIELPTDPFTGKTTGKCLHSSYAFEKEVDSSSPFLYEALTTGKTLKSAEFRFYNISHSGREVHYFTTLLEDVIITEIEPFMMDIKDNRWMKNNHHEYIDLRYKKITWNYVDGNIMHTNTWQRRG